MSRIRTKRAALGTAGLLLVGLVSAVSAAAGVTGTATAAAAAPDPGSYVALTPTRILDTRTDVGHDPGAVPAGASITFAVTGANGVPAAADVSAVVFNLTVTDTHANGYISAYPAGHTPPSTSSLNFTAGETRSHAVVVPPGAGGAVTLRNGTAGTVNLVADVSGYFTAGAPTDGGEFGALAPARLLDTRAGLGAPKAPVRRNVPLVVPVLGHDGVPGSGVSAVLLNLTDTQPTAAGYLVVSPASTSSSSVNFRKGQTTSNLVVAPVNSDGDVVLSMRGGADNDTVEVVADVSGYFLSGSPAAAGRVGTMRTFRLLDTRQPGQSAIPAHATITLPVAGFGGVPSTGATAAALNVTVASPAAPGYLTAYPSDVARPVTSTVNFASTNVPNLALTTLGADGAVHIYNGSSAAVQVVVDVSAFVGPIPGPLTWSGRSALPGDGQVSGVSCGSPSFCVATDGGSVITYNGSTWSSAQAVTSDDLRSITCVTSGFCAAVAGSVVYTNHGGTWSGTTLPIGAESLLSVSCASASFCVAGQTNDSDPYSAWVFDGSHWTASDPGITSSFSALTLSCPSTTFCMGVDFRGVASSFNGTTWTSYGNAGRGNFNAVSCVSASFCMALGDSADTDDAAISFNGTSWGTPVHLAAFEDLTDSVRSVSCSSATFCVAITDFGYSLFYNGVTWSSPIDVNIDAATQSISCTTKPFCLAVDPSGFITGT